MPSTLCANPGGDAASIATGLPDFTGPGPCAVAADTGIPVTLPPSSGCGDDCFLEMHLTAPSAPSQRSAANACPFAAPYPVLFLYPGFQLRASFYGGYAERLASWGLAVVRYDTRLLDFVPAGVQTGYVTHLLEALAAINSDPSSQWHQRLDLSRLGAAGHSRGGKLAALHLASRTPPLFTTAYLIDPVDSHGGEDDPSAVEALRGRGQRFGIAAAGVVGPCNPKDRTRGFWQVAGPGSWRETVLRGGHAQFCNISNWLVEHALDALCGRGNDTHQAEEQLGEITFDVKE
ncbi:chlorophyllase I [Monoraphidium neglectum]|uniref:Chlorophyllase I n=1 Tax=Monoraphidium neglectum TaxID=145388 RepID=A0A0D2MUI5_9CHLO|nr:chlorophyllase I [Monoraphidium neglectum]KIZ06195.1 chlorophyllase I [Monoraphidium neglectum]|eukprot:XP_013905214.1 chlorophyllase I [Monoraphidium neglectum]